MRQVPNKRQARKRLPERQASVTPKGMEASTILVVAVLVANSGGVTLGSRQHGPENKRQQGNHNGESHSREAFPVPY